MTRPDIYKNCTKDCECAPKCYVCGKTKAPSGRSVPAALGGSLCDRDCAGYYRPPVAGHLWPGELAQLDGAKQEPTP